MILLSLFLTTLAAASLVFAAPASNNDARGVSRWSVKDSQSIPQIIDTGRSEYKNTKRETNAERMARGLPPMKPRKLFDDGTKVAAALQPRTSVAPKNTILIYDTQGRSGMLLGYFSIGYTTSGLYPGCYYLTTSCSDSITNPIWHSDDLLENPAHPGIPGTGIGYSAIGGTTESLKDASWDTSKGYNMAFVNGVVETYQGTAPYPTKYHSYQHGYAVNNNVPGSDPLQTESNIWDCSNPDGECTPFWITPSETRKTAYLAYIPNRQNILVLTSDLDKLRTEWTYSQATQVRMFLENNYVCPN